MVLFFTTKDEKTQNAECKAQRCCAGNKKCVRGARVQLRKPRSNPQYVFAHDANFITIPIKSLCVLLFLMELPRIYRNIPD